ARISAEFRSVQAGDWFRSPGPGDGGRGRARGEASRSGASHPPGLAASGAVPDRRGAGGRYALRHDRHSLRTVTVIRDPETLTSQERDGYDPSTYLCAPQAGNDGRGLTALLG